VLADAYVGCVCVLVEVETYGVSETGEAGGDTFLGVVCPDSGSVCVFAEGYVVGVSSTGEAGNGMFSGYHAARMAIAALNSSSGGRFAVLFLVIMTGFLRIRSS